MGGKGKGGKRQRKKVKERSTTLQLLLIWMWTYWSTRQQVTDLSSALQGVLLCELKDKTQYSTSIGVYLLVA